MPRTVPSYTIDTIALNDFSQFVIRPYTDNTDPEHPVQTLAITGYYKVKTATPGIVPDQKFENVTVIMNTAQRNAFVTFANSHVVPVANSQEGQ